MSKNLPSCIVFDAFGTLIKKPEIKTDPYSRLITDKNDRNIFITSDMSIDQIATEKNLQHLLPIIKYELAEEKKSIRLYADVKECLKKLHGMGKRIGLCSNLAYEYGETVKSLLPEIDEYILSFKVGSKKPDPEIFEAVCQQLQCKPENVLFIGDSKRADLNGPREFGMNARLINRENKESLENILNI